MTAQKFRALVQAFTDLFLWYGIPPTPLHQAVQEAAKQAGWVPPWHRADEKVQKEIAGKKSGALRGGRAGIRHCLLKAARARLKPAHRLHAYSNDSIDALHEEYLYLLKPNPQNPGLVPFMMAALSEHDRHMLRKVKRETLIKDLKVLGIRSKR